MALTAPRWPWALLCLVAALLFPGAADSMYIALDFEEEKEMYHDTLNYNLKTSLNLGFYYAVHISL